MNELKSPKIVDIRGGFIASLRDEGPEKCAESLLQAINEKTNSVGGTPEEWFKAVDDILGQLKESDDALLRAIYDLGGWGRPEWLCKGSLEGEMSPEVSEWIQTAWDFLENMSERIHETAKILAEARYSRAKTEARERADEFLASLEHEEADWYRAVEKRISNMEADLVRSESLDPISKKHWMVRIEAEIEELKGADYWFYNDYSDDNLEEEESVWDDDPQVEDVANWEGPTPNRYLVG